MIYYTLREAVLSGVEEVYIVVSRRKGPLWRYLEGEWARDLEGQGGDLPRLELIEQPEPKGSGEALWRVRELVENGPFAWMMPDFVLFGDRPPLVQMLEAFGRYGADVVGLLEITKGRERLFGNVGLVKGEFLSEGVMVIKDLSGKAPGTLPMGGERVYKAVGRWILSPSIFPLLLQTRGKGEWDDTPALQELCRRQRVLGVLLKGEGFDVGNLAGYRAACLDGASGRC